MTPSAIKENKEREEVLRNDQKLREQAATMHDFANVRSQSRPRALQRHGQAEGGWWQA
jgi:hypothetical protein